MKKREKSEENKKGSGSGQKEWQPPDLLKRRKIDAGHYNTAIQKYNSAKMDAISFQNNPPDS